jgi:hypothetical protein
VSSVLEQNIAAAITAVNTSRPVGVPEFKRERSEAIKETDASAAAVYPNRESPEYPFGRGGAVVRKRASVLFEVWGKATSSLRPTQVVDASLVWIVKTLVGNKLGGLAISITEGEKAWAYEQGAAPWVRATQELIFEFQHLASDPEART